MAHTGSMVKLTATIGTALMMLSLGATAVSGAVGDELPVSESVASALAEAEGLGGVAGVDAGITPMLTDAEKYDEAMVSAALGYSVRDVRRVGQLLDDHRGLESQLRRQYPDSFGGMYVEYSPPRIVVLWKDELSSVPEVVSSADGIDILTVSHSEYQLEEVQSQVNRHLDELEIDSDSWIDIRTGTIQVDVTAGDMGRASSLSGLHSLDDELLDVVQVNSVEGLSEDARAIYAGLYTTSCTAGFNVRSTSSGVRRATTAGHCGNSQAFGGASSSFVDQWYSGSRDFQIHSLSSSHTLTAQIYDGASLRAVTSTRTRSATIVGETLCKYGKTAGYDCGVVSTKTFNPSYVPNGNAHFIRVNAVAPKKIVEPGDSGGPFFFGNRAYGYISGHGGSGSSSYGIYMSISFLPAGWAILTG